MDDTIPLLEKLIRTRPVTTDAARVNAATGDYTRASASFYVTNAIVLTGGSDDPALTKMRVSTATVVFLSLQHCPTILNCPYHSIRAIQIAVQKSMATMHH